MNAMRMLMAALVLFLLVPMRAHAAASVKAPHTTVSLIASTESAESGSELKVGLRFQLDKDWHIYWLNSGDSGEPVKVKWTLPQWASAGPIEWPHPARFRVGPLMNYGYEGDVTLPVTVYLPDRLPPGPVVIEGAVTWLVCQEECIPGKATLRVSLPVKTDGTKPSEHAARFASAAQTRPRALPEGSDTQAVHDASNGVITLTVRGALPRSDDVYFFPAQPSIIKHAADQTVAWEDSVLTVTMRADDNLNTLPPSLPGVLKVGETYFEADASNAPLAGSAAASTTLLQALLLAFLGGIILNGMPCVFPVLSIKAVGLMRHANGHRAEARVHGLIYALGVLVSFWILAGLLLVLRAAGGQVGWGFQLQSPFSILGLTLLLFVFALNLAGMFEIRASWVGVGNNLASRKEAIGAFFSGVLATIVATPCTAPFMGTALGYAATQPPAIALAVFTALALGLAIPYVLLSWFPVLGRWLPKPGRWMETLKQVMAFPLFATVIWLLWVLNHQAGANAVAGALTACLMLAVAAWIYQRWQTVRGTVAAVVFFALSLSVGVQSIRAFAPPAVAATEAASGWDVYSPARLQELLDQRQAVFIDFTAAWCVTCKLNEATVLQADMLKEMRKRGVIPMQADWTNDDPDITAALKSFGRDGVPLYVLYGIDGAQPKILPQILTKSIVLEAMDELHLTTKEKK